MKCKDCTDIEYKRRGDPNMKCFYEEDSQEELEENFDWQSFRAEAAKGILCAMIQGGYAESRIEHQSALAVKYADTLILRLKEKEEK